MITTVLDVYESIISCIGLHGELGPDAPPLPDHDVECYVCEGVASPGDIARDHNHNTGKFRGFAHNTCNLAIGKIPKMKPLAALCFHNAKYDSSLFLHTLLSMEGVHVHNVIGEGPGTFKSFSFSRDVKKGWIEVVDTYAHLKSSLAKLIGALPDERKVRLRALADSIAVEYDISGEEAFEIVKGKMMFPHGLMEEFESLEKPIPLDLEAYRSDLTGEIGYTEKDLELLKSTVEKCGLSTLRDLHDFYLPVDVLGLADVFESHRRTCYEAYLIDPVWFIGTPGVAFSALLKSCTGYEKVEDVELRDLFNKHRRGGYVATMRTAPLKFNNPDVPGYKPWKPCTYGLYADLGNLYGHALRSSLAVGNYRKGDPADFDPYGDYDGMLGATVEVDLEYPHIVEDEEHPLFGKNLHDSHQLPLLPYHGAVGFGELSEVSKAKVPAHHPIRRSAQKKMLATFYPREKMILDARALRYALDEGLVLVKVHRVAYYSQSPWARSFIDGNTLRRKQAMLDGNGPLKDLMKLTNVSVSGKLQEDKEGRHSITIVKDCDMHPQRMAALYRKKEFIDVVLLGEAAVVRMKLLGYDQDGAYATAGSMLDIAKTHAYKMIYELRESFESRGHRCYIIYHDTDSVVLLLEMRDASCHPHHVIAGSEDFDFSNYPKGHPLYDASRCGDVGIWKDEAEGLTMAEWIAPQPRTYCYTVAEDGKLHIKSKGIPAAAARRFLGLEQFRAQTPVQTRFKGIQVRQFRAYHEEKERTVNFFDTKTFGLGDGTSLPFGHYSLKEIDMILGSELKLRRRITCKRSRSAACMPLEDLEKEHEEMMSEL